MTDKESESISELGIIIPAYNEEEGIAAILEDLDDEPMLRDAEILVIDDGSTDRTCDIVRQFSRARLIKHRINEGYGASIITGIRAVDKPYVVWCDADGQHRADDVSRVAHKLINEDLDYCIGVRDKDSHQTTDRKLGRYALNLAVKITSGRSVEDFNSGLRGFKRDVIKKYLHLLPKRFGASTTTTLIMLERGYSGSEVPIHAGKRLGKSTVNPVRDGARTLLLILRIFLLFKPLLFFGSIGFGMIILGSVYGIARALISRQGIPVLAALIIIFGIQSLFFGLLADQISALRREKFE
ncbi:MAG: glycosyltransferase family 2 protein [Chloroflexota bacterium]|nr:glycosyltransferase family 2 protein [Chloroflexota bacterium]